MTIKAYRNPEGRSLTAYLHDPVVHALIFNGAALCMLAFFLTTRFPNVYFPFAPGLFLLPVLVVVWVRGTQFLRNGGIYTSNKPHEHPLSGKWAIVTGSSGGLGEQCCIGLARCGCNVIMTARTFERGQEALGKVRAAATLSPENQSVRLMDLELNSESSIRSFAKALLDEGINIDILVNNAGVMVVPKVTPGLKGVECQIATNHLAHFLLTQLLMSKIKACGGRVINVSSLAHFLAPNRHTGFSLPEIESVTDATYDKYTYYGISKLANIWFTKELQRRFGADSDAVAYSLHPGVVQSEIGRHVWNFHSPFQVVFNWFLLKSPEIGAFTHMFLCTEPKSSLKPGAHYTDCDIALTSPAANNEEKAKEFWDWSERKINEGADIDTQ